MKVYLLLLLAAIAYAQAPNDLPNGYRTIRDWAQPPNGVPWAAVTAVEVAPTRIVRVCPRASAICEATVRIQISS